ncbi:mechanosensitive ion channel family protein [Nodosilinea sp. P-1105]|nr:mechanosensitive ion channel family protein [Nodosilinea sp. P-1105]
MKKGFLRFSKFVLVGLGALLLILLNPPLTLGQEPLPVLEDLKDTLADSVSLLQPGVSEVVYHPVRLDGVRLFKIASVAASQSANGNDDHHLPLQDRARHIETQLQNLVRSDFEANSLQIRVSRLNNQTVIVASDDAALDEKVLVTVTELDSVLHGVNPENLAGQWAGIIDLRLQQAQQERQPEYLRRQGWLAAGLTLVVVGLSIATWHLQRRYHRQWQALEQPLVHTAHSGVTDDQGTVAEDEHNQPSLSTPVNESRELAQEQDVSNGTAAAIAQESTESETAVLTDTDRTQQEARQHRIGFQILLLQWLQVGLWVGGLSTGLILFPFTRAVGYWLLFKPLSILLIWLLVTVANRLSVIAIDWYIQIWSRRHWLRASSHRLKSLRIPTLARALTGLVTCLWIALGIVLTMDDLGIPLGPLLAGASILGFAITWSFQNLMQDVSMGVLILLEDQFAVGDVVGINDILGTVETMNLRSTQLRHESGELITISNSMITSVRNLSKDWAQVILSVPIAYDSDLPKAMQLMHQTATAMGNDPAWRDLILAAPLLLGVDGFDASGASVRMVIKTQPLKQGPVERELRCRLKLAFDRQGISIGVPHQKIWVREATLPMLTPLEVDHQSDRFHT